MSARTTFLVGSAVVIAAFGVSAALAARADTVSPKDKQYLAKTHLDNAFEMKLGAIAARKGTTVSVREFGTRVVADHRRADTSLKTLASGKGIVLTSALTRDQSDQLSKVEKLSGKAFDKAFLRIEAVNGKTDRSASDAMVKSSKDKLVTKLAADQASVERRHQKDAAAMEKTA
jgi:putative membrane protein